MRSTGRWKKFKAIIKGGLNPLMNGDLMKIQDYINLIHRELEEKEKSEIIKEYIESILPSNVKVVAQGAIVAEKLREYLLKHPAVEDKCTKNGIVEFLTSENTEVFNQKAESFINCKVRSSHVHF